ncbi:hypothetical protein BT93_G0345 [Corymbia citriodora subsp. variegata]|nr:hypothetical protein BT93_G0345 [Corymbia citriodora subsp. variegata]
MASRIHPMNFEVKEIALFLQQAIAGYGFRPTEEELINYLKSAVPGWRESFCIIPILENVYKINPWDLPAKFHEKSIIPSIDQEWWFICPRTQNQRTGRKTPCGFSWKITGSPKDIKAGNDDRKIGSKILLVFQDGARTNWVIHEYHLLNNEYMIQERMVSLIENNESQDNEDQSVMDFTLDNGLPDEYIQLVFETNEEDEDLGNMLNGNFTDADFFHGDQMPTQYGQTSGLQDEYPALLRNQRTRTSQSLYSVIPLDEKKGMVENKFNGSLLAPEKPMTPPVRATSVKYYGKDEVPRYDKVKQETGAKSTRPEYIFFDETAARAKNGRTRTIGSLHSVVPLEQNNSHVSSAKPMELPKKPKTSKLSEPSRVYINEEPRLEKVKKQEFALRNVKTECVSWNEAAATTKVLKYQEHCSTSDLPKKKTSREIEHAREKANSVTALTRPTTKSTKSSSNPSLHNLVNVLIGIFLLFAITCQVFNL